MFAFVSAGADKKANTWELVRAPSSLLQRLQRAVALEAVGESGCSLGAKAVVSQTASRGVRVSRHVCQWALTQKRALAGRHTHLSDLSAAAEGSSLLSTIAPGSPTCFLSRSSSVMLFLRKETSGISQKSVMMACSSTTAARFSAASPVMLLTPTL